MGDGRGFEEGYWALGEVSDGEFMNVAKKLFGVVATGVVAAGGCD